MKTKSKSPKKRVARTMIAPPVVDRRFLNDLADRIYDPRTRRFLRLCNGTLQNGPDPTNKDRPMHCGLGELYYAMTGAQPNAARRDLNEEDVIDLAVDRSTLTKASDVRDAAVAGIKALAIPAQLREDLLTHVDHIDDDDLVPREQAFRDVLDDIPSANDDCVPEEICTTKVYQARSRRVAKLLRQAAKLLPA